MTEQEFVKKFVKERLDHSQWTGMIHLVSSGKAKIRIGEALYKNVQDGEMAMRGIAELVYRSVSPYFEEKK